MKIKIGNKIYDGKKGLIIVYLTDNDKSNIRNMDPSDRIYAEFPHTNEVEILKVLSEVKKEMEKDD